MANHLRRQIREAVAGAVTGLTTTAARVYQARVYPVAKTITLVATDIEMQGTSSRPVGQAAMTYEVVYAAAENSPDVGL